MESLDNRLGRAAEALRLNGPRLALLYAQTILALVTLRVQSDGLAGRTYSTHDFPLYWFKGKELNSRGTAYVADKKKRTKAERANDPANWGGFRAAQGLSADVVNLTYSGRMFRSITVVPASSEGTKFYAALAAADMENANKIEWNITRYGNFLRPTAGEEAEAQQAVAIEVNRILKTVFQA